MENNMITYIAVAGIAFGLGLLAMAVFSASGYSSLLEELADKDGRIDRALAKVTPNAAHVGKVMAKILRGEG